MYIKALRFAVTCFIIAYIPTSKAYSFPLLKITGTIFDAITNQPLPSASVILFEKKNNKLIKAELSNTDGYFQFRDLHSNTYILRIQYIGYQEYILDSLVLDKDIELQKITLTPIQQNLSEINVTAIKPIIEQTATSTTVNVAESSLATGGTAYDMLQKIPGVSTKDNEISTRGKTLSLLLNGRLINIPAEEMIALLKSLPASSIEKIEINNNPSGKYDGQVQAILDIKTLKPKNDNWEGNINVSAGAGRMFRNSIGANIFYQKKKLSLSTGWNYLNNSQKEISNEFLKFSIEDKKILFKTHEDVDLPKKNQTAKAAIDYVFHPYHTIGLSLTSTINHSDRLLTSYTSISQDNSSKTDSIYRFIENSYTYLTTTAGNMYYQTSFDTTKNKELIINIDYYNYKKDATRNYTTQTLQPDFTEKNQPIIQLNDAPLQINIRSATADYTHTTSLGTWQTGLKTSFSTIYSGSDWKKYTEPHWIINEPISNHYSYTEHIHAAYGTLSSQFKKINLQLSLRGEYTISESGSAGSQYYTPRSYFNLFPTINVEYHPSTNHEWVLSYQQNIKRPSYQELNPFTRILSLNYYLQGNALLFPQLNHIWGANYSYKNQLFLTVTWQQQNNYIDRVLKQIDSSQIISDRPENYTKHMLSIVASLNKSILPWWQLNSLIELAYIKTIHPEFTATASTPALEFKLASTINLPYRWKIESSGFITMPYSTGLYKYGVNSSSSIGVRKSFLQEKIRLSLLMNINTNWMKNEHLYRDYTVYFFNDRTYFMLSINYTLGKIKKREIKNKKSGIDTEKNRTKEQ